MQIAAHLKGKELPSNCERTLFKVETPVVCCVTDMLKLVDSFILSLGSKAATFVSQPPPIYSEEYLERVANLFRVEDDPDFLGYYIPKKSKGTRSKRKLQLRSTGLAPKTQEERKTIKAEQRAIRKARAEEARAKAVEPRANVVFMAEFKQRINRKVLLEQKIARTKEYDRWLQEYQPDLVTTLKPDNDSWALRLVPVPISEVNPHALNQDAISWTYRKVPTGPYSAQAAAANASARRSQESRSPKSSARSYQEKMIKKVTERAIGELALENASSVKSALPAPWEEQSDTQPEQPSPIPQRPSNTFSDELVSMLGGMANVHQQYLERYVYPHKRLRSLTTSTSNKENELASKARRHKLQQSKVLKDFAAQYASVPPDYTIPANQLDESTREHYTFLADEEKAKDLDPNMEMLWEEINKESDDILGYDEWLQKSIPMNNHRRYIVGEVDLSDAERVRYYRYLYASMPDEQRLEYAIKADYLAMFDRVAGRHENSDDVLYAQWLEINARNTVELYSSWETAEDVLDVTGAVTTKAPANVVDIRDYMNKGSPPKPTEYLMPPIPKHIIEERAEIAKQKAAEMAFAKTLIYATPPTVEQQLWADQWAKVLENQQYKEAEKLFRFDEDTGLLLPKEVNAP